MLIWFVCVWVYRRGVCVWCIAGGGGEGMSAFIVGHLATFMPAGWLVLTGAGTGVGERLDCSMCSQEHGRRGSTVHARCSPGQVWRGEERLYPVHLMVQSGVEEGSMVHVGCSPEQVCGLYPLHSIVPSGVHEGNRSRYSAFWSTACPPVETTGCRHVYSGRCLPA